MLRDFLSLAYVPRDPFASLLIGFVALWIVAGIVAIAHAGQLLEAGAAILCALVAVSVAVFACWIVGRVLRGFGALLRRVL